MDNEYGGVLAETAILLPVFILLIFGLYDSYRTSESLIRCHIEARNAAWQGESGGSLDAFMDIIRGSGDLDDGFDVFMQTEHGIKTDTVKTLLLPQVTTRAQVWIDRYVWSVDIGIDEMMDELKDDFGADGI